MIFTKEHVNGIFESFRQKKVLVIGDLMIDSYHWGDVSRISPEAPVPIVHLKTIENRLGGAANVGLNLQSLGAEPIMCGLVGNDQNGKDLNAIMTKAQLKTDGLVISNERPTTVKTRTISNNHQLLRVDREDASATKKSEELLIITKLNELFNAHDFDVVIFEDYDKGALNQAIIQHVVQICKAKNIPCTVDPKKRNFNSYNGVTLFKPNLKEMIEGTGQKVDPSSISSIQDGIVYLKKSVNHDITLLTLSEYGMYIQDKNRGTHAKAHLRQIADVSGAGDSVIATASLCLASSLPLEETLHLANLAGGLVCEYAGVVPIHAQQLKKEALLLTNQ